MKAFADRLARSLSGEEGAHAWQLLRTINSMSAAPPISPPVGEWVGIWRRNEAGWERQATAGELNLWADQVRIGPRTQARRVLLLGESVARGFFYDPHFTPAQVLEQQLRSHWGAVEVIDLARTNMNLEELEQLGSQARALQPDAVVVFAGNNWNFLETWKPRAPAEMAPLASALRQGGVPALRQYVEERLKQGVAALVEKFAGFYQREGVPVVWLVPEFNLVDWQDPPAGAPWLRGTSGERWFGCWQEARLALGRGEVEVAAGLAAELIALDQGCWSAGEMLLAECHRLRGDEVEIRRTHLERARDAALWDLIPYSPRPFAASQETLRRTVARLGMGLVDLPKLFAEHLEGGLPDRRLFLDYCHLTSEGIQVAMAGAVACLLQEVEGRQISWRQAGGEGQFRPPKKVEGEARFLAAIHNAHWGQSDELIRQQCSQALKYNPQLAQAMLLFVDVQNQRAPLWLCRSAEQLAALTSTSLLRYILAFNDAIMDRRLVGALVEVFKEAGLEIGAQVAALRQREHSVAGRQIDLLDSYYFLESPVQRESLWTLPGLPANFAADFYRAYGEESVFVFVGEVGLGVELDLTCRLPAGSEGAPVRVTVNGGQVLAQPGACRWQHYSVLVPGVLVRQGMNEVRIWWPVPDLGRGEQDLARAADALERGGYPELFPVFGELHTFVARGAPEQ